jgi:protein-S-isoprenylcysteine O-methyltransferase Ste14
MAFGMVLFYLGLGLAIGSVGALALASFFAFGLLVYIKATEEEGLKARFGDMYLKYQESNIVSYSQVLVAQ